MVYILLANGFEEIEMTASLDVLRRGGVKVSLAAVSEDFAVGAHGMRVSADMRVTDARIEDAEMVVIPGGAGVENIIASADCTAFLRKAASRSVPLAAICAGPAALAKLGLIDGKNITCYPGLGFRMTGALVDDRKLTSVDGKLITGRGPGAAIDFALELLRFLKGDAAADKVASDMFYVR